MTPFEALSVTDVLVLSVTDVFVPNPDVFVPRPLAPFCDLVFDCALNSLDC